MKDTNVPVKRKHASEPYTPLGMAANDLISGEQALAAAVIQNAVDDYLYGKPEAKREAKHWLFGNDGDFAHWCDVMGIEPDYIGHMAKTFQHGWKTRRFGGHAKKAR